MKTGLHIPAVGIALVVGGILLWFYLGQKRERRGLVSFTPAPQVQNPAAPPVNLPLRPEDEHRSAVIQFLSGVASGMKRAGIPEMPPVTEQLRKAADAKDHGEVIRAFHEAVYGRWQKMHEVLPAVRAFLHHDSPFVRYTAARTLYTAGDRSGYETLHGMISAGEPILDGSQDLRVDAAKVLAQFRETEAITPIRELYSKTQQPELLIALATLGVRATEAHTWPFISSPLAIYNYGKTGAHEFVPNLRNAFLSSTDGEVTNASAWALARLANDQACIQHLVQAAYPAINASPRNGQLKYDRSSKALQLLGSIQSPVAKQTLERALESSNPVAVQYAVVNLLFNQPEGSEKAKQVVLRELRGEQRKLGTELLLNVASKIDDPEIRAAGEAFDQRSGDRSWKLYSVERRQWPIYNWIDDYVVALNQ